MSDVFAHGLLGKPAAEVATRTISGAVTVLIVDDDDGYVSFVRRAFDVSTDPHIDLIQVRRLSDIAAVLRSTPVSVILLDVELPDGNGLDWLREHRADIQPAVIVI